MLAPVDTFIFRMFAKTVLEVWRFAETIFALARFARLVTDS
jgi:hypothetical protein